jgi:hypothetical protein
MNAKQIGLAVVLADFMALNLYVVYEYGLAGLFDSIFSSWAGTALFVDLCIALSLITVWLWRDARSCGMSPIPYVLLTLSFGSAGPLLYLIRRFGDQRQAVPAGAVRAA